MQWKSVELFCAVVAERSFSRGAAQLGLTQSAASQAISLLEAELGAPLINRGQRPLGLTPAGQIYYEGCRQLLADYRAIEDRVRGVHSRVIGTVRVAAIYSVGLLQMERFVRRFEEEFPDAVLRLEYQHPDRVYEQLRLDQVDVGLLSYPRTGTELVALPWQEQPMVLVVTPGHPLTQRLVHGRLPPAALAGVTFLGFTRELPIRRAIDRWLRQEGVQVRVQHEFDNIETIKKAVECGTGVAILPEPTVGQEVVAGTLVALPMAGAVLTRPLGIVHKKHRHLSPAVRQFVERLGAEVGVAAANRAEGEADGRPPDLAPHALRDGAQVARVGTPPTQSVMTQSAATPFSAAQPAASAPVPTQPVGGSAAAKSAGSREGTPPGSQPPGAKPPGSKLGQAKLSGSKLSGSKLGVAKPRGGGMAAISAASRPASPPPPRKPGGGADGGEVTEGRRPPRRKPT